MGKLEAYLTFAVQSIVPCISSSSGLYLHMKNFKSNKTKLHSFFKYYTLYTVCDWIQKLHPLMLENCKQKSHMQYKPNVNI